MKQDFSTTVISAFLSSGISRAFPLWLLFRLSLQKEDWRDKASGLLADNVSSDDKSLISAWLSSQKQYELFTHIPHWPVTVFGALLGVSTMLAALSYSGSEPVNLWLLLGLFCFVPLFMTLIAAVTWVKSRRTAHAPLGLWEAMLFKPLRRHFDDAVSLQQSRVLKPWLMYKMQSLAIAYQVLAIASFLLVLTFKDVAFGWSSTLIQGDDGMSTFFSTLAAPWAWISTTPSAELIANSRFYRGDDSFNAELLGQWWSYIFFAMIFYGLLPRVILSLWMKRGVKTMLINEIHSSGAVERFLQAVRTRKMPVQERTLESTSETAVENIKLDNSEKHIVAWQFEQQNIPADIILGKNDWEKDEACLQQQVENWHSPVVIVVTLEQTPTAELSDVIFLIREINSALSISLVVLQKGSQLNERRQGQLSSWQYFSKENSIDMSAVNAQDIDKKHETGT